MREDVSPVGPQPPVRDGATKVLFQENDHAQDVSIELMREIGKVGGQDALVEIGERERHGIERLQRGAGGVSRPRLLTAAKPVTPRDTFE